MTIHKSKGLGFDVVILPDLGGDALTTLRGGIAVHQNADTRAIDWVFDLPARFISEADPVLARHLEQEAADACYEALCKFYVALTRAKRGLYCIADRPGQNSRSHNFVMLLEHALRKGAAAPATIGDVKCDCVYAAGDRDWFRSLPKAAAPVAKPAVERKPMSSVASVAQPSRVRPTRRTPSGSETHEIGAAQLFSPAGRSARARGTAVHAIFEQIAWLDAVDDPAAAYPEWESAAAIPDSLRDDIRAEVLACLDSPEIRAALSRPSPGESGSMPSAISAPSAVKTFQVPATPELWRERRFEILLGNDWLSGTFDRIVIDPGARRATILDFKTDRIDPGDAGALERAIAGYQPQLEAYRRVLAQMTGLDASAIECRLLFTRLQRVCDVP
jgi:ATP-dependent helicase/nuclease subunit A